MPFPPRVALPDDCVQIQVQYALINRLQTDPDMRYDQQFKEAISTEDPQSAPSDFPLRMAVVLSEDYHDDTDINSYRTTYYIRFVVFIYAYDPRVATKPELGEQARVRMSNATRDLRKVLTNLVQPDEVRKNEDWDDRQHPDPTTTWHRTDKARWTETVIQITKTVKNF